MGDRNFRLPKSVMPSRYDLSIDVDLDKWSFRGTERIDLRVAEPTDRIALHAVELSIGDAVVTGADGRKRRARIETDAEAETITLHLDSPLPTGSAELLLPFGGEIRARLRGFYRSQKDGERYAATQFEAADARRAFPCFDEPEFKARFALTLIVPPGVVAIANGAIVSEGDLADGRREIRFAETPPISSYLVAYTVGPYEPTPVAKTPSGVPVRVFLPRGMAARGLFARDAHVRSLAYLETYTAVAYPYGKVDAIGVPDFEAGAMENPGAITYRLTAIAADAERASTPARKNIFYTAAHELTHMWWGDLVTMAWWDDLWLNESFATFVGYKAVAELVPQWGMWRDFVATLSRPFHLDSLVSTHPISFEVKNAKQATERFDVITYWKGAGVVRMIEGFLGADVFRSGVRTYLDRYRESNATADDFWRELASASGRDVGTIANAWIREPGHPLVDIQAERAGDGLRLKVRQERFYADPEASRAAAPATWPIPMVIKYGRGEGTAEERVVVDRAEATIDLQTAAWFYPNGNAAGFYRFALDEASLASLVEAVQTVLNAEERLDLIGNQWALLKAGKAPLARFFSMLGGFRAERDRAVLSAIAERLGWLRTHVVPEALSARFERFVADLFRGQFEELGWTPRDGESEDDRLRRAIALHVLGELASDREIESEARRRLDRYIGDRQSIDPNLASVIVALSARGGDRDLYARYLEQKRSAAKDPEEEQRFLFGLTAFEDGSLIDRTLTLTLTDEVRPQDRAHLLARLLGSRPARTGAWRFVRDRWRDLVEGMDPMLQQNVVRALAQLTPPDLSSEVRAFLPTRIIEETRETAAQALEQLAIDTAACERLEREFQAL